MSPPIIKILVSGSASKMVLENYVFKTNILPRLCFQYSINLGSKNLKFLIEMVIHDQGCMIEQKEELELLKTQSKQDFFSPHQMKRVRVHLDLRTQAKFQGFSCLDHRYSKDGEILNSHGFVIFFKKMVLRFSS